MASLDCSTPEEEFTTSKLIMLVIIGNGTVVGAWINAFIVTVCCIDRFKNKFLSAGDQILMALATNRFCFLIIAMLRVLFKTLSPTIYYKGFVYRGLKAALWFFISSNLWLSACLCLFYCVKIANFSHFLFISLKLKISRIVPALLLSSELLSLVNVFPFISLIFTAQCDSTNGTASGNLTTNPIKMHINLFRLLFLCGFGFFVVLVIFVISALLLLVSLWRHAQQMRDVLSGHTSPRMTAHVRAVKIISCFLVIYLVNFVALMFLMTDVFSEETALSFLSTIVVNACPAVHSTVLILNNPKFKKVLLQTLRHGGCKWGNGGTSKISVQWATSLVCVRCY